MLASKKKNAVNASTDILNRLYIIDLISGKIITVDGLDLCMYLNETVIKFLMCMSAFLKCKKNPWKLQLVSKVCEEKSCVMNFHKFLCF